MTDPTASEAARALAARRPRATYTCAICGAPFEARIDTKRPASVCQLPRCRNARREQTRKPKAR